VSASGVAETPRAALAACLGEASEIVAQADEPWLDGETIAREVPRARDIADLPAADTGGESPGDRVLQGRALPDGAQVEIPARLCLRVAGAPKPSGVGVAAGRDRPAARRAALFELVERRAFRRWRDGGLALPPSAAVAADAEALIARLGRPEGAPAVSLALLPSEVGAPVALARSPLGWGCAAAETAAEAMRRAILELVGAETGRAIEAARGRTHPAPRPVIREAGVEAHDPPPVDPDALIRALAEAGEPAVEVDLSRAHLAAVVVKLFCAALDCGAREWRGR
jgi:ribosomal protein S12 methylthiotransferase accessory factor YcaO